MKSCDRSNSSSSIVSFLLSNTSLFVYSFFYSIHPTLIYPFFFPSHFVPRLHLYFLKPVLPSLITLPCLFFPFFHSFLSSYFHHTSFLRYFLLLLLFIPALVSFSLPTSLTFFPGTTFPFPPAVIFICSLLVYFFIFFISTLQDCAVIMLRSHYGRVFAYVNVLIPEKVKDIYIYINIFEL